MFKQLSPCMGCTERHLACHDGCPKYKEWKACFDADKSKYQADKQKQMETKDVIKNGFKNIKTKKASNLLRSR